MFIYRLSIFTLVVVLSISSTALADCTSPAGKASQTRYDTGVNKLYYCNDTDWVEMGGIAPAAGAGSVPFCTSTTTAYSGSLGGQAGADAKCQAEFGSEYYFSQNTFFPLKAASSLNLSNSSTFFFLNATGYPSVAATAWAGTRQDGAVSSNCSNWSTGSSAANGGVLQINNNSPYNIYPQQIACNTTVPLICCTGTF